MQKTESQSSLANKYKNVKSRINTGVVSARNLNMNSDLPIDSDEKKTTVKKKENTTFKARPYSASSRVAKEVTDSTPGKPMTAKAVPRLPPSILKRPLTAAKTAEPTPEEEMKIPTARDNEDTPLTINIAQTTLGFNSILNTGIAPSKQDLQNL